MTVVGVLAILFGILAFAFGFLWSIAKDDLAIHRKIAAMDEENNRDRHKWLQAYCGDSYSYAVWLWEIGIPQKAKSKFLEDGEMPEAVTQHRRNDI